MEHVLFVILQQLYELAFNKHITWNNKFSEVEMKR